MKKFIILSALLGVLAVAPHPPAFAADAGGSDQIGIYVAPKFVYGLTHISGSKIVSPGESRSTGTHNDSAFGGSVAVGYDFEKQLAVPVRAEIEYAGFSQVEAKRHSSSAFDGTVKQTYNIHTVFANAYFDIDTSTLVTPYVGAGLGTAFITSDAKFSDDIDADDNFRWGSKTKTNLAWNVGTGVGFDFNDNITLDVGYRFVGLGSAKTKTGHGDGDDFYTIHSETDNLYQHQFSTGVRLTF
jgi:opacity protein-like surface antigen